MVDSYLLFVERIAAECDSRDHEFCGGSGHCRTAATEHAAEQARLRQAAEFDAGKERLSLQLSQPSANWSTSALLRTARDLLLTPPTRDPLWRSIAITTALARLGERGLSADALVRTGFARDLVLKIIRDASMFWCAGTLGTDTTIPAVLQPWVDLLDGEKALASHRQELPAHVASVAIAGAVGGRAEAWLREAAIAHIVGWRIDGYLRVERHPKDLVLMGGRDATLWIIDRFTRTFPRDWSYSSLNWELAFNANSEAVAQVSGVPAEILTERTVTSGTLVEAVTSKITKPYLDDFEERKLGESSIASLATLLDGGQYDTALRMARRFHEAQPQQVHFALAYAFCLIIQDPAAARSILDNIQIPKDSDAIGIRLANLVTCSLVQRDLPGARAQAKRLANRMADASAWLWEPQSLFSGQPRVRFQSISDWLRDFEAAVPPHSA
ncbi:hypothetical protein FVA74_00115 [Salinibacterium sp. dk2585]|uniref:hypothetical protein n=1 Tax=unclassified Salinibacterium TaxID=2632331 RepID=UPI0011C242BA|nr:MULTISPECIES: hypothetical protein [unclassified Salinibacterium]QEE60137.1 hypothetical protein FVA74_00115 [Salinibacterium sp. dk2585]TXK55209.1 hypothetical protein FVP63_00260 [Salinibacterium sp. dk5596]